MWAGTEAGDIAARLKDRVSYLGTVESFQAIAGGISKYLIGSMAAPVRWLVRLSGVSGDKEEGIKELKLVADRGHYLAPFANILLAIAYVRDHDKQRAREWLTSLRTEFPSNPLFGQEIARLDSGQ